MQLFSFQKSCSLSLQEMRSCVPLRTGNTKLSESASTNGTDLTHYLIELFLLTYWIVYLVKNAMHFIQSFLGLFT